MEFRKNIIYRNWKMVVQPDGQVEVTTAGETRIYNIDEPVKSVTQENEYVYIYIGGDYYYQFKFEENNFLVGDKFNHQDEAIEEFAMYVFGE